MWAPTGVRGIGPDDKPIPIEPLDMRKIARQLAYSADHPRPVTLPKLKCLEEKPEGDE